MSPEPGPSETTRWSANGWSFSSSRRQTSRESECSINPDDPTDAVIVPHVPKAAKALGISFKVFEVRDLTKLDDISTRIVDAGMQALIVGQGPYVRILARAKGCGHRRGEARLRFWPAIDGARRIRRSLAAFDGDPVQAGSTPASIIRRHRHRAQAFSADDRAATRCELVHDLDPKPQSCLDDELGYVSRFRRWLIEAESLPRALVQHSLVLNCQYVMEIDIAFCGPAATGVRAVVAGARSIH